MFPSVIPLYGTDCSRVTHPSAARMFSVQALRTSPLDLHVLSTPPAFVLSQDQTLMFDLSRSSLPLHPARQSLPQPPLTRCLLSQNLTVLVASILRSFDWKTLAFLPSLYRFQGSLAALSSPPPRLPAEALVSSGVCYYINFHPVCQPPFFQTPQTTISSPPPAQNPQYIAVLDTFCPLLHGFFVC